MQPVMLILRKIIKTVITRCDILRQKYTKLDFGRDSAPDPTEGTLSAPQSFWLNLPRYMQ